MLDTNGERENRRNPRKQCDLIITMMMIYIYIYIYIYVEIKIADRSRAEAKAHSSIATTPRFRGWYYCFP